jgi:hypothetical protein
MTTADTPWDTEWAAQKAAEALRYLGRNFPECLENLRVASLDEHETAADEAAIRGDEDAYLKALREPTCEPAGTRPCGFVEERHDGPSGRARPRAEGEEKGQGGRRAPARGTKGGVAPAPCGRGGKQKRALGKGASGVSVEPEALERHPSRRREGSTPCRNRGFPTGTFPIGWDFLWATPSLSSLRIVNYPVNLEKMQVQTYVCSRRLS